MLARKRTGNEIYPVLFKRLPRDGGPRWVFANGRDQIVKFDRRLLPKAGLEADINCRSCHWR